MNNELFAFGIIVVSWTIGLILVYNLARKNELLKEKIAELQDTKP